MDSALDVIRRSGYGDVRLGGRGVRGRQKRQRPAEEAGRDLPERVSGDWRGCETVRTFQGMGRTGPYIGIAVAMAIGIALAPFVGWLLLLIAAALLVGVVVVATAIVLRRNWLGLVGAGLLVGGVIGLTRIPAATMESFAGAVPGLLLAAVVIIAAGAIASARRTRASRLASRALAQRVLPDHLVTTRQPTSDSSDTDRPTPL